MLHRSVAMLPLPSSLRSLLRLSRRLRFLTSSSPSDGAGWTTGSLAPSAPAISSAASDPETPADFGVRGVFDPAAGRIALQGQPSLPPPPPSSSDEEDRKGNESVEELEAVREKVKGESSGGKGQARCSAVAAEGFHHAVRSWIPCKSKEMMPQSLQEVITKGVDQAERRIPLPGSFGMEVARVFGGGIVPGSLVLVSGDPGVGKSSLLLQLASILSEGIKVEESSPVVYVSGEESIEQIGNRADRMSIKSRNMYIYSSMDIEDILDKIQPLSPRALIIDSIQTVYLRAFPRSAGNIMQVKECTSALLRFAKLTNIPVFLIGHVTKAGDIAGPRLLQHMVDVILYMEGERSLSHRLLRSVKNRFGSTDELGVFEMSEHGLQAVRNPSEMLLTKHDANSKMLAGVAVAVILDGFRTFAIEVQALCVSDSPRVVGIPISRAALIISVLTEQAGLKLHDHDIVLNVVSGFKLKETAGDLAIAASICSSFLEFPIPNDIAFIGEVGLGGELRSVPRMDKRVKTIAKFGYKKCVVPKALRWSNRLILILRFCPAAT